MSLRRTLAEAMASISLQAEDTVFNEFSIGTTVCEDLGHELVKTGVAQDLIDEFFEIQGDHIELKFWIKRIVKWGM